uniref:Uncharacterized protein n=1 Tax=Anguilla anguilla TaxID=7936 RepID=A0A0E9VIW2_ANGAN
MKCHAKSDMTNITWQMARNYNV